MAALALALAWCGVHFLFFLAVCRIATGRRERTAFLFHAGSFALLLILVAALAIGGYVPVTVAAGMLAIHAIYSLTVLEIWSLSEGSYSLTMLGELRDRPMDEAELIARFAALGESKRASRRAALEAGGLILGGDPMALTRKGRRVARAIAALRAMANFKDAG
jgi:hypothetical protein